MLVLVADDDAITRRIVGILLTRLGHVFAEAENGSIALELAQAQRPDAIIADFEMPGLNGLDLLRQIRQLDGDDAYTYFILLTSHDDHETIAASSAAGVDDHLGKPLDHRQLTRRMAVANRLMALQKRLTAANHRMQQDLLAAQRAQRALQPPPVPPSSDLSLTTRSVPCEELAGDLVGGVVLDDQHLGVHVVDISGHGVSAALLAVQVAHYLNPTSGGRSLLWGEGGRPTAPAAVAKALNDRFHHDNSLQFMTMAYGLVDRQQHRVDFAFNAHPPPMLLRQDGHLEEPTVASQPLGMFPSARLHVSTWSAHLQPGDQLLVFSDGVTEANNALREEYGRDRLRAAFRRHAAATPDDLLDTLLHDLRSWTSGPTQDDVSLLLLRRPACA